MRSFEEIFTQYFSRVYRFALSLTRSAHAAEEITQQTFFKALKKIDQFEGRSDPGTWLCSIAKNEYFDMLRRRKELPADGSAFDGTAADAADQVERTQDAMRIHRHLHALNEPYREVFMLRVFGELSYAQIASLFGKTESWARVVYYRAKLEIQERFQEEEKDHE